MRFYHKWVLLSVIGFWILIFVLCAGFSPVNAATGQASGIRGTVFTKTNTPLSNVKITIQREGWNNQSSEETAQRGCFDSGFLLPGDYTVTFQHSGYRTAIYRHLSIPKGRFVNLKVYLEPQHQQTKKGTGALKKKASEDENQDAVIYEPPFANLIVEREPCEIVMDASMLAKLPRGLNPLSLAPLAAGVNDELLFDGLSVNGASSSENLYFVDGTDTTTIYSGISGFDVHIDFVEEISVQSSGLPASRAGSTGGVIDVVTKSGGNRFHGSLQLNVTGGWLDGKPRKVLLHHNYNYSDDEYAVYPEDTWTRWQPGVALGGYIVKNKLWFYGGFIPSFDKRTRDAVFIYESDMNRTITQKTTEYQGVLKLTAFPTDRIRLSLSGLMDYRKVEGRLPLSSGISNHFVEYEKESWRYPSVSLTGNAHYSGTNVSIQLNGGYWRRNQSDDFSCSAPYFVHWGGGDGYAIPPIPIYYYWPQALRGCGRYLCKRDIASRLMLRGVLETRLRWLGNHHFTIGGQLVRKTVDKYDALNSLTRFVWGKDFESPTSGETVPTTLGYVEVRKPYGHIFKRSVDSLALFLGDEWNPLRNFVLQLGVRLESDEVPSLSDDQVNTESPIRFGLLDRVSPRLGFVYEWGDEKKTTVFGNFSVYFDTMKWNVAQERYGGFRWTSHYYDIVYPFWEEFNVVEQPNPSYMGGRYFESKNWSFTKFNETQPDIEPFQKYELSIGIQKWLNADVELNVSFVHNWIKNVVEDIGVPYPDGLVYFIANPGSDWIQEKYNEAQAMGTMPEDVQSVDAVRRYTAITVRLDKRFSRRWLGGISYTWSRLYGNYSPMEIDYEKYLSEFDVWYVYYSGSAAEVDPQQIYLSPLFNVWYFNYDHNGEEVLGLLPTDRTHQIKAYGAYTFDCGLTVGFNAFVMSGTPVQTETTLNGVDGWYPYGRGDLGRTPWIWQLNTYLEYNLKLNNRFNLQFSLNIDNITDNGIARRVYQRLWEGVFMDPQLIFEGFKSIGDAAYNELYTDPRFMMERKFQSPIAARLGAKLLF